MARIGPARKPGVVARLGYWMARRRLGEVPEHMRIMAHHPRLLRAYGHMELGQAAAKRVDAALKLLAQIRVAMRVGCPY